MKTCNGKKNKQGVKVTHKRMEGKELEDFIELCFDSQMNNQPPKGWHEITKK